MRCQRTAGERRLLDQRIPSETNSLVARPYTTLFCTVLSNLDGRLEISMDVSHLHLADALTHGRKYNRNCIKKVIAFYGASHDPNQCY